MLNCAVLLQNTMYIVSQLRSTCPSKSKDPVVSIAAGVGPSCLFLSSYCCVLYKRTTSTRTTPLHYITSLPLLPTTLPKRSCHLPTSQEKLREESTSSTRIIHHTTVHSYRNNNTAVIIKILYAYYCFYSPKRRVLLLPAASCVWRAVYVCVCVQRSGKGGAVCCSYVLFPHFI